MPFGIGRKHRFTEEEDRVAKVIMSEYLKKGYSESEAKRIAYSTINKHKLSARQKVERM